MKKACRATQEKCSWVSLKEAFTTLFIHHMPLGRRHSQDPQSCKGDSGIAQWWDLEFCESDSRGQAQLGRELDAMMFMEFGTLSFIDREGPRSVLLREA